MPTPEHIAPVPDLWPLSARAIPSDDVLFQEIGGESVLLDLASEKYFGLDSVGTRFWLLLREQPEIERAIDVLLREYEVTADQLRADLSALLQDLSRAGLVRLE
jgi:hypothetical protein